jgi:hypothetical protein
VSHRGRNKKKKLENSLQYAAMSSVYVLEPPTKGKVVLTTTAGPLDIELWPKEAPKAVSVLLSFVSDAKQIEDMCCLFVSLPPSFLHTLDPAPLHSRRFARFLEDFCICSSLLVFCDIFYAAVFHFALNKVFKVSRGSEDFCIL